MSHSIRRSIAVAVAVVSAAISMSVGLFRRRKPRGP